MLIATAAMMKGRIKIVGWVLVQRVLRLMLCEERRKKNFVVTGLDHCP